MEKSKYVLAYDVGSTGIKAVLHDFYGTVVLSKYQPYKTYYPIVNGIEQEPEDWWNAVVSTTKMILKEGEIDPSLIEAVVPVGHQIMAVPVNEQGELLSKRVLYCFDGRSEKQAKEIVEKLGGYDAFYKIHGLAHPPESLAVCKVMWMKENQPEVYENTYKFLQSKGFIILNLTDQKVFVDDFGDASNTGWMDIKERRYSQELADAAGVDIHKLPEIKYSHEIAGYVGKKAASLTGLLEGTPVFVGTGDVPAACVGAGVVKKDMHYCSIGSANWNGGFVENPCLDPSKKMVNICHLWKDFVCFQYTAASCISRDWFEDTLCDVEQNTMRAFHDDYFDIVTGRARKSSAGARGVIYLPYLRGGGGPHWNANSRGAFVGLNMSHTKNDMAQAVLEGVAFNFRWMMEATKDAGVPFDNTKQSIRVIGGGARNLYWIQIYADIVGAEFQIIKDTQQATAKGGFIAAAVGLGWYENYEEAAEKTIHIQTCVKPNPANREIYDKAFSTFKKVYEQLQPVFDDVVELQKSVGS